MLVLFSEQNYMGGDKDESSYANIEFECQHSLQNISTLL
jgi:hypothetical protein